MTPVYEMESGSSEVRRDACPLRWIYRLEPLIAITALIITFPLALAIGIVITVLSRRSPLIRHTRVGWGGSTLRMLKFRTMWGKDTPRTRPTLIEDIWDEVPTCKSGDDPRVVSRFAAICRRYSLDELPQFYHVARGEMSFVGPRPITREELDKYYGPHVAEVLQLRPGITGLWQVLGRNRLSYSRRMRLDIMLVRRVSPYLYLWILLRTVPKVVCGYDAF